MHYEVTLGFDEAEELADLMVLLATNKLLGSVLRVGYGLMEQSPAKKTKAPVFQPAGQGALDQTKEVRPHIRNGKEVEGYKRGPRTNRRPGLDFRIIQQRAAERGKSGFNRMGTMLLFLSQAGSATTPEIKQYLRDEGLEPYGNPVIAITTRHLAQKDGEGGIQITPDGAQYLAQLMAAKRGS